MTEGWMERSRDLCWENCVPWGRAAGNELGVSCSSRLFQRVSSIPHFAAGGRSAEGSTAAAGSSASSCGLHAMAPGEG